MREEWRQTVICAVLACRSCLKYTSCVPCRATRSVPTGRRLTPYTSGFAPERRLTMLTLRSTWAGVSSAFLAMENFLAVSLACTPARAMLPCSTVGSRLAQGDPDASPAGRQARDFRRTSDSVHTDPKRPMSRCHVCRGRRPC